MNTHVVYLSRIFLELFLKHVYPTMVAEKFQILVVKIIRKDICELKSWICLILLMSSNKTLSQILITTPGKQKSPISYKQCVFRNLFFPSRKGKDYEAEERVKIKLCGCRS